MITLIILYIYIYFICIYSGVFFTRKVLKIEFDNAFHYFWIGIIAVVTVGRVCSLFCPTSSMILQLFYLLVAITSLLIYGNVFKGKLKDHLNLITIPVILFITFFSSQQSITFDEGLYHASYISWMNDYGLVKGLGNVHGRLAFNSNWHFFSSLFNGKVILNQPYNQLNGIFLINTIMFINQEKRLNVLNKSYLNVFLILIFCPLLFVYHVIDPSADYIVLVWTMVIIYELFYLKKNDAGKLIMLILSIIFVVTIKLSVAPLCIFLFPLSWYLIKTNAISYRFLSVAVSIVLLWVLSNIILSGYIVYPYLSAEFISPSWKVPLNVADNEINGINYAMASRWSGENLYDIVNMSKIDLLKLYLLKARIFEKVLLVSSISLMVAISYFHYKDTSIRKVILIWYIGGFLMVLLSAPDLRFYAAYTFSALAILLSNIKKIQLRSSHVNIAISVSLIGVLFIYNHLKPKVNNPKQNFHEGLALNILSPEGYPDSHKKIIHVNGVEMYLFDIEKKEFAWDVIPSVYTHTDDVYLYSQSDISKGFYMDDNLSETKYIVRE